MREGQNRFMRVKVAVPLSKPLRRGGFIGGSDGQRYWVSYKYERLPLFLPFLWTPGSRPETLCGVLRTKQEWE